MAPQLLYTELAIVLGLTQLFLPLAIISCYSAVAQVDPGLDDAARGLGASRIRTFWSIVVPLSMPGIVVAATLVFAGSVTAYTTPYLLGGSSQRMLSTQLFSYSSITVDWAGASATALIMTVLVFLISGLSSLSRGREPPHEDRPPHRGAGGHRLRHHDRADHLRRRHRLHGAAAP